MNGEPTTSSPIRTVDSPESSSPGGTRRFIIAAVIVVLVLAGSAFGLLWWIHATNTTEYDGPAKIVYPEHRYYR